MTVIKLAEGGLLVCSPIALDEALRTKIEALGEVRWLVAPNALHHVFLKDWQEAYPTAQTFAPPGLRKKRPDLRFDEDLSDLAPAAWAPEMDQVIVRGNLITSEVVFFHRPSGTVIFTDLIQHFAPGWFTGWRAVVARLDRMTAPLPEVPQKFRNTFINRSAARKAIRQVLDWPIEKVVMAHAPPVRSNGRAFIAQAFQWLRI
ncbi:MAG: hypothetical protein CGW95_12785 [Phenylobacterium zucineum]|nr:MAG: hypothetical protein CGW95_12785 [Phenylobacterium zucineum]